MSSKSFKEGYHEDIGEAETSYLIEKKQFEGGFGEEEQEDENQKFNRQSRPSLIESHVLDKVKYFDLIGKKNKDGKKNSRKISLMEDTFAIFRFFNHTVNRMLYNAEQCYFKHFKDERQKLRDENYHKVTDESGNQLELKDKMQQSLRVSFLQQNFKNRSTENHHVICSKCQINITSIEDKNNHYMRSEGSNYNLCLKCADQQAGIDEGEIHLSILQMLNDEHSSEDYAKFMSFVVQSRIWAFVMAIMSYFLQMSLMISMAKESWANLLINGIIWVPKFQFIYTTMVAVTFFLIDSELRSSVELLAYSIITKQWTTRYLEFEPLNKKFNYHERDDDTLNYVRNLFNKTFDYFLILIAIVRLVMVYVIESMIIVQVFQVDGETSVQDQVADFLVLIIIIQIDNMLVETPMYNKFSSKYKELNEKLNKSEKTDGICALEMEYGVEGIEIPIQEKELLNKLWLWAKVMHVTTLLIYILTTYFNMFGIVKHEGDE